METYRTLLFVPGIKQQWFEKIPSYDMDGIILDLEDSVPLQLKAEARAYVAEAIPFLSSKGIQVFVRINKGLQEYDVDDLKAVVTQGLTGLVLPKPEGPEEIKKLSVIVEVLEVELGIPVGTIRFIPILETARSMQLAYEIACCDRVIGITGLSAKNGDVARALGYQWTPEGLETLYLRSKVVMSARAAGVLPIGGLWQDIHNLEGLKKNAAFNRQLGFVGELVLHPSNVPIINEVYSPSDEEITYYSGMIEAFQIAEKRGETAIMYEGEHVDYAHVKTAREVLTTVDRMVRSK
ncbi:HpcH/HpaI aldolase/citrate lyase family protein [Psychrobacillus soli]|uniref:CoA ester lyase n=1 Tax=Psychrobacillus soli TaxID=1543965 RepID=A0A544T4D0_9BACI|nr:CoA ester lyase [Psychrobacillus soli]TQR12276.1 CoA ester lyase [Psychrobacillus soli]